MVVGVEPPPTDSGHPSAMKVGASHMKATGFVGGRSRPTAILKTTPVLRRVDGGRGLGPSYG